MAATMRSLDAQAEGNSLNLPLIGATPNRQAIFNPLEDETWALGLIGGAIDKTMQRKEAAILMGIDAGQLTRQLTGDGHLSARRLGALPREFWMALIAEIRGHYGELDRAELAAKAEWHLDEARRCFAQAAAR